MRPRTLTLASFFSVAMAATLVGALVTSQVRKPEPAVASTAEAQARSASGSALGLETFRDIARAVNAGVVNINTSKTVRLPRYHNPLREFFQQEEDPLAPGPEGDRGSRARQTSLGTGFVIDEQGYILTNRHVIEGADEISVSFPDGKRHEAKIIGQDARTDVALIKIEPKGKLVPIPLGNSDQLEVGEWVMAVGNPFGLPGGGNSVTVGVVSFKGRDLQLGVRNTSVEMIQTDAAINPGNSGGPLINTRGEVIGINTLIVTGGAQASAGVGFSVPINVAKEILPQLRERGKVTRGWMGVTIGPLTEDLAPTYGLAEAKGALVNSVVPGSPADKAGLQPEDAILAADGREVQDNGDLSRRIASLAPGTGVKLDIVRGKEKKTISVTLGTFPDQAPDEESADASRASLGMTLRDLTPAVAERIGLPRDTRGVVVIEVEAGEVAELAGLTRGDVIVTVNGEPVSGTQAFERAIAAARPAGRARLRVYNAQIEGYRMVALKLKQ